MAALSYVVFTFLQIKNRTSWRRCHIYPPWERGMCIVGALLLGGVYGGIGGAIGMTIGDLLDPIYIVYAPKTFILKFCIGLITGLVAHKIGKISTSKIAGTFSNGLLSQVSADCCYSTLFFDPLFGYFYKLVILGKPAAEVTLSINIAATSINAVLSVIVATAVYMALRPVLAKSNNATTSWKGKRMCMKLNTLPPKLLIINDISGVGRCSMSVSLPVVSVHVRYRESLCLLLFSAIIPVSLPT